MSCRCYRSLTLPRDGMAFPGHTHSPSAVKSKKNALKDELLQSMPRKLGAVYPQTFASKIYNTYMFSPY